MPDDLKTQAARALALDYAAHYIGRPYRWGGDDPMLGFDCSGFVIEILQAVGLLPATFDTTADGLFRMFRRHEISAPAAGALVFWFSSKKAVHVEMMLDLFHTIGASGGGSATISLDAAAAHNAFIKIRPIGYRGANYKIVDPFAGGIA